MERVANKIGTIGWMDLTVDDADAVRNFYSAVVGWEPQDVSMGDYSDYCMAPPKDIRADGHPVAGICHRRGANADLPPVWLVISPSPTSTPVWPASKLSVAKCSPKLAVRAVDTTP